MTSTLDPSLTSRPASSAPRPARSPGLGRLARRARSGRLLRLGAALVLAWLAGGAPPSPARAEPPPSAPGLSLREVPFRHRGFTLSAGGGVSRYQDQETRGRLGTGGYWELRALLGSRSFVGSELAYLGSTRAIHGQGGALLGNGVEAALRLNLPLVFPTWGVTPFVFVGPGFTHLQIVGAEGRAPGASTTDLALVTTAGAGISVSYHRFAVTARFTHRQLRGGELIRTGEGEGEGAADLTSWSGGLSLGYQL